MESAGLYYQPPDSEPLFLCGPFAVLGRCAQTDGSRQGVVITLTPERDQSQQLILYRAQLAAGAQPLLQRLLDRGLRVNFTAQAARLLQRFFLELAPALRCQLVERSGWVDDQHFVLGAQVVGRHPERVVIDPAAISFQHESRGNLAKWQTELAALCRGNSRLLFGLSLGFAAPLVPLTGVDAGIFHLKAPTTSGKTSLLHAVASISGSHAEIGSWQVSEAGLEAAALAHNHQLMILDEFAEIPPRKAQSLIYQITNGRGALRARSDGRLRVPSRWQTLVLSTGELSLAEHCARLHVPLAEGQKVRMVDLPALAEEGQGLFENLHGHAHGALLAQTLVEAAQMNYGVALPAYLEQLCATDHQALRRQYQAEERQFLEQYVKSHNAGPLWRVARRFFLVGFAGELASGFGITGWSKGEALQATTRMFEQWLDSLHGQQQQQTQALLELVHTFLEGHAARFVAVGTKAPAGARLAAKLAGYHLQEGGRGHFFVKAQVMTREVLKGWDSDKALEILAEAGLLMPCTNSGKPYINKRLPTGSSPTQRLYHLQTSLPGPQNQLAPKPLQCLDDCFV